MLRFAGCALDPQRSELRGQDGAIVKLRPKSFDLLRLFAENPGRVLSKRELIDAVWPNIHVSEDSLFQCVREIRSALGDDQRQLIKLVSGRGYLFDTEVSVSGQPSDGVPEAIPAVPAKTGDRPTTTETGLEMIPPPANKPGLRFGLSGRSLLVSVACVAVIFGLVATATILSPDQAPEQTPPTLAVMPITEGDGNPQMALMASNVTARLADGLSQIDGIRVVAPRPNVASASLETMPRRLPPADFVLNGELNRNETAWQVQARLTNGLTGEVRWTTSFSVDAENIDPQLQQSRIVAGLGHSLALRINALLNSGSRSIATGSGLSTGDASVVIDQAMAFINQTTPERFNAAQTMLESALAADPDNVDLQAALAAHLLRGIQTAWYNPADVAATENRAQAVLERAMRVKPGYFPVLQGYCRFLAATNRFVEGLVACAKALTFDPWNGTALFNLGLAQIQLGRFEDALATFRQADQFDTPPVSRWTWLLGAGWTYMMLGRDEEAVPWLLRSIAITPGTGRTHLLLAAAYQRLGRTDEAKVALARGLELRPGSTGGNVSLPTKNTSPVFLEASQQIMRAMREAGLPQP